MTDSSPNLAFSEIVATLRAAGCVFAEEEARLLVTQARTPAELAEMVGRRASGEPVEYVVGWARFCGLRVAVQTGVFVPRVRSEYLVRSALDTLAEVAQRATACGSGEPAAPLVVDLCCGSGAVSLAIATARPGIELHATDVDPIAVACARENLSAVDGTVWLGDLFEALPAKLRGRVGVMAVNAPYVPTAELGTLPAEARLHEPVRALDGGADGVDVQRRVGEHAAEWLCPDGCVLVETSERQAELTARALQRGGLETRTLRCEELDATVVLGKRAKG